MCVCVSVCVRLCICLYVLDVLLGKLSARRLCGSSFTSRSLGAWRRIVRCACVVSLRGLLFGRNRDRTSGELMAVLTQLQLSGFPNRGILNQWCCVVCSVWHVGRICGAYRRLVDELPDLALTAPVFRINEEQYLFMKVIVLCGGS